jgi:UDP-N-acetylglucosamine 2-epimerase (non-hydrolysing)
MIRLMIAVGARPNFMKAAPIMAACAERADIQARLVHTGQHYDEAMSDLFFRQLGLPEPDVSLGVGSDTHGRQTGRIMQAFEPVMEQERPDALIVVGDVNSTAACALVGAKLGVPVAHVEAGLRSFDRRMPEEINRIVTDAVSDLLFCTEEAAVANLRREGVAEKKVFLVGNVMIDTLLASRQKAEESTILSRLSVQPQGYAVLTLHRPENVDHPEVLAGILEAVGKISREIAVVFPAHPRTRKQMAAGSVRTPANLKVTEPLGYLDFLKLTAEAAAVLTDSGGIQEETTILRVPCLTLRENTERPVTVERGTNRIAGTQREGIVNAWRAMRGGAEAAPEPPALWDGKAAERIVGVLAEKL